MYSITDRYMFTIFPTVQQDVHCLFGHLCFIQLFSNKVKNKTKKNNIPEEEKAGCFAAIIIIIIIILQMYCYYKCSVALPHGAVGWSVVCNCGIS